MGELNAQTIHLYFGARQTCLEMMRDRKYTVPEYLFNLTEMEFGSDFNKYSNISGITDSKNQKVFIIMFNGFDKLTLFLKIYDFLKTELPIDEIPEQSKDNELTVKNFTNIRIIIIYNPQVSSKLDKLDKLYSGDPYQNASFIEAFDVNLMFVNPTKHIYQPIWILMEESEILDIMQKYEARSLHPSRNLFASVCFDDPINRYYGGKPPCKDKKNGDMYKILRDGVNIFYRKVSSKRMNLRDVKK